MNIAKFLLPCALLLVGFAGCGEVPQEPTAPAATVTATPTPETPAALSKAAANRMVAAINTQNIQAFSDVLDAQFKDNTPAPGYTPNKEGTVKMFADFFAGFPDIHLEVHQIVAENDTVVLLWTTTGTNSGEFMGSPATNKPISFDEIHILKVKDGKITEHTRGVIGKVPPKKQ